MTPHPTSPYTPPAHPAAQATRKKNYWRYSSIPEVQGLSKEDRKAALRYSNKKLWHHWQPYIGIISLQIPHLSLSYIRRLQEQSQTGNTAELHHLVKNIPIYPSMLIGTLAAAILYNRLVIPILRKHTRQWIADNHPKTNPSLQELIPNTTKA